MGWKLTKEEEALIAVALKHFGDALSGPGAIADLYKKAVGCGCTSLCPADIEKLAERFEAAAKRARPSEARPRKNRQGSK